MLKKAEGLGRLRHEYSIWKMRSLSSVLHHASISEGICPVRIKNPWEFPRNHPPVKGIVSLQWARVEPAVCASQWCFLIPFMAGEHLYIPYWVLGESPSLVDIQEVRPSYPLWGFYPMWEQQLGSMSWLPSLWPGAQATGISDYGSVPYHSFLPSKHLIYLLNLSCSKICQYLLQTWFFTSPELLYYLLIYISGHITYFMLFIYILFFEVDTT